MEMVALKKIIRGKAQHQNCIIMVVVAASKTEQAQCSRQRVCSSSNAGSHQPSGRSVKSEDARIILQGRGPRYIYHFRIQSCKLHQPPGQNGGVVRLDKAMERVEVVL